MQMWNECVEDKVSHGRYGSKTPYLTIKKQHMNKMKLLSPQVKPRVVLLCIWCPKPLHPMHKLSKILINQIICESNFDRKCNLFSNFKIFIAIHVVAHNLEMQMSTVLSFFPPIFMFDLFTSVQKFFCWWKNWS